MFTYCYNNPVNMTDPSGCIAIVDDIFSFAVVTFIAIATLLSAPAVEKTISNSINTIASGISSVVTALSQPQVQTKAKSSEKTTVANPRNNNDTIIYRYGGTNPGNFVPTTRDVATNTGLSFSTIPKPGAAMTTIGALNATGVVYAVQDTPTHVSVRPVGASIKEWRDAGSSSIWTTAIKSVVIKWDGVK